MNTYRQTTTAAPSFRKNAIAAGVLFLITHVTSIGAVILYGSLISDARYIVGSGSDAQVTIGVIAEIILAMAIIGTAVALFPIVRRQNEGIALGYVGLRTLEACIIAVGTLPLLAVVSLRPLIGTVSSDPAMLATLGSLLVTFYKWAAMLGPGLVCGTNTVLMAYLMLKSGLVPRIIPVLGLVGGPIIFVLSVAKMLGNLAPLPAWLGVAVIPIFSWEVSLALYLIFKGFRPSAAASLSRKTARSEAQQVRQPTAAVSQL